MKTFGSYSEQLLTREEKAEARNHWLALMPAGSQVELDLARERLRIAPSRVRSAVITAIVALWSRREDPIPGQTPFD